MKIKTKLLSGKKATALLVTLFIMTILAGSIAGYLYYVKQQAMLGFRSQTWNVALSVSEAGVEEGLEALNSGSYTGWSQSGNFYIMGPRILANGNSYYVTNDMTDPTAPVITARAFVNMAMFSKNRPPFFLAAAGMTTGSAPLTRAVRVTTSRGSLFLAPLVAKHQIDMNGNNVETDSFDSADPSKSTNGRYDPTKYRGDYGDVGSNDGVINAVSVGNANVYGKVHVGPNGTVSVGSQGGVGTHDWQAANGNTPEPGYELNDANFTFPDTTIPNYSGYTPVPTCSPQCAVISILSASTNQTVYTAVSSLPGAPGENQTIGAITTNTTYVSTTIYPGNVAGLQTNSQWVTSSSYPGNIPGLTTNCVGFTTVTNVNPGAQQCLSVNNVGTVNSTSYPGAMSGLATNTTSVTSSSYPQSGTYAGNVTTNYNGGGKIRGYTYNQITGYTYPLIAYTYATSFTYSYTANVYTYPTTTYTYTVYTGVLTYQTNYYDHVLDSGNYYSTANLTGNTLIRGTVTLVLPNGYDMTAGVLTLDNNNSPNGNISIYAGGTSLSLAGNGIINNPGYAGNFIVYAAPTVTSVAFSGNGTFTGILVAPYANVSLSGGGNNTQDFSGALMANSITLNGHFNFHYDEALGRQRGSGRYLITSWNEIP